MPNHERYIPALGLGILTPLFDPFLRYVLREAMFKQALIVAADLGSQQRILDLGCGTGTLTILVKQGSRPHMCVAWMAIRRFWRWPEPRQRKRIWMSRSSAASPMPYPMARIRSTGCCQAQLGPACVAGARHPQASPRRRRRTRKSGSPQRIRTLVLPLPVSSKQN
jgi:hypothetical protein